MTSILTLIYLLVAYVVSRILTKALTGPVYRSSDAAMCVSIGVAIALVAMLPLLGVELWSFSKGEPIDGEMYEFIGGGIFVLVMGFVVSLMLEIRHRKS